MPIVRTLFSSLQTGSSNDKKFVLAILLDFVQNIQSHEIIRNLAWTQGVEVLLNSSFATETMTVSKIFQLLTKDPTIFSQMNNMMSFEYLNEVHNGK